MLARRIALKRPFAQIETHVISVCLLFCVFTVCRGAIARLGMGHDNFYAAE